MMDLGKATRAELVAEIERLQALLAVEKKESGEPRPQYKPVSALSADICLGQYRATGQGERLLTAYAAWRDATRASSDARKAELSEKIAPGSISADQLNSNSAWVELLGLQILSEIDPLIADLRRITSAMRKKSAQMDLTSEFRSALRIGKGREPHLKRLADQRRIHVTMFMAHYTSMGGSGVHKTDTAIAKEIEATLVERHAQFGLPSSKGWETILNDWRTFLKENPEQMAQAELIRQANPIAEPHQSVKSASTTDKPARSASAHKKADPTPPAPGIPRPRNTKKPTSWR
ncbi:MAG: hypothetical protein QM586_15360 [Xenophilus sp.]